MLNHNCLNLYPKLTHCMPILRTYSDEAFNKFFRLSSFWSLSVTFECTYMHKLESNQIIETQAHSLKQIQCTLITILFAALIRWPTSNI